MDQIWPKNLPVHRFAHGHLRGSLEQACKLAVMLGIKMLNQDEGHARIYR
jgi:ribosome-binding protein aMBF1 (putative translation factor)